MPCVSGIFFLFIFRYQFTFFSFICIIDICEVTDYLMVRKIIQTGKALPTHTQISFTSETQAQVRLSPRKKKKRAWTVRFKLFAESWNQWTIDLVGKPNSCSCFGGSLTLTHFFRGEGGGIYGVEGISICYNTVKELNFVGKIALKNFSISSTYKENFINIVVLKN